MKALCAAALFSLAVSAAAFDFWQYPEMAEKHSFFLGGFGAAFSFTEGFRLPPPEFYLDYVLPVGLPFSLGAFFAAPDPNLSSFGLRAAYHFNFDSEDLDLYALYVFDFGFLRNDLLERYGDKTRDIHYYDFRAGVRRRFGRWVCVSIETGSKLSSVRLGLAIKLL